MRRRLALGILLVLTAVPDARAHLPKPRRGFQMRMHDFHVQPSQDREVCEYRRLVNDWQTRRPAKAGAAGQVLDVSPASGSQVPIGSGVTLYVSNAQSKVPNVVGQDLNTARAALEQAGFANIADRPAAGYDPKKPEGTVLSQSPRGGTFAKTGADGDTITLFVNHKPSPSPTPSPTSPSPTPSESPSPTPT